MHDRPCQSGYVPGLFAPFAFVAGGGFRGTERGRGLTHRNQSHVRGDADHAVGTARRRRRHRRVAPFVARTRRGRVWRRRLFGRRLFRRWGRRGSGRSDCHRRRLRRWRWRSRGERRSRRRRRRRRRRYTGRHRSRPGRGIRRLSGDDRRDERAVRIAVRQTTIRVAHHVITACEQRRKPRIRRHRGVDQTHPDASAGGELPRLRERASIRLPGAGWTTSGTATVSGAAQVLSCFISWSGPGHAVGRQRRGVDHRRLDRQRRGGQQHVGGRSARRAVAAAAAQRTGALAEGISDIGSSVISDVVQKADSPRGERDDGRQQHVLGAARGRLR